MASMAPEVASACSVCRERLVVRDADCVVIRNAIIKVETQTGRVSAKCPRCKSWMEVPLRYIG
jgi:hypothetical protein